MMKNKGIPNSRKIFMVDDVFDGGVDDVYGLAARCLRQFGSVE